MLLQGMSHDAPVATERSETTIGLMRATFFGASKVHQGVAKEVLSNPRRRSELSINELYPLGKSCIKWHIVWPITTNTRASWAKESWPWRLGRRLVGKILSQEC